MGRLRLAKSPALGVAAGAALLAAVLTLAPAAQTARASPAFPISKADPEISKLTLKLIERISVSDCPGAVDLIARIRANPRFERAEPNTRAVVLTSAALCEIEAGEIDAAYADLKAAEASGTEDSLPAGRLLFSSAVETSPAYGVAAAERLARSSGDLASVESWRIVAFNRTLRAPEHAALHLRFLKALFEANWRPADPLDSPDGLWRDYAIELDRSGDHAAAARVLARIETPDEILRLRVDGRFTAVIDADPARYGPRAAFERRLARLASLESDPATLSAYAAAIGVGAADARRDLKAWIALERSAVLHRLGRVEEARATAEAALAAGAPAEAAAYLRREVGVALWDLGRFDEGVDWFAAKGGTPPTLDWLITRTSLLEAAGRPKDVLAITDAMEPPGLDADPDSRGQYTWILVQKACALQQLRRRGEMKPVVAWLQAERFTGDQTEIAYGWGALCYGDREAVRDIYLRRLADPFEAADALLALGGFQDPPGVSARERWLSGQQKAFARDPAIRAAIARAGRTEAMPLTAAPTDFF